MLIIGEYIPAHDGQPALVDKDFYRQGYIFKDEDAFLNQPDEVCYVPELTEEDDDEGYTANDIIELCGGDVEYAKDIFYRLDWQHPSTLIDEDEMYADEEEACMTTEEKMQVTMQDANYQAMTMAAGKISELLGGLSHARCEYLIMDAAHLNSPSLSELSCDNRGNRLIEGDAYMIVTCSNGCKYYINVTADSVLTACAEVFQFIQHKL